MQMRMLVFDTVVNTGVCVVTCSEQIVFDRNVVFSSTSTQQREEMKVGNKADYCMFSGQKGYC